LYTRFTKVKFYQQLPLMSPVSNQVEGREPHSRYTLELLVSKNTTHSENSIFGITIVKSIRITRQWSQQSLQAIARTPTSNGTCRVAVAALAGTDNKICEQAT
jgi:hypothetical protein